MSCMYFSKDFRFITYVHTDPRRLSHHLAFCAFNCEAEFDMKHSIANWLSSVGKYISLISYHPIAASFHDGNAFLINMQDYLLLGAF